MAYLILEESHLNLDEFSWLLRTSCEDLYFGCRSIQYDPWAACFRSWGHQGPHLGAVAFEKYVEWND
jgi:hypothetical protein